MLKKYNDKLCLTDPDDIKNVILEAPIDITKEIKLHRDLKIFGNISITGLIINGKPLTSLTNSEGRIKLSSVSTKNYNNSQILTCVANQWTGKYMTNILYKNDSLYIKNVHKDIYNNKLEEIKNQNMDLLYLFHGSYIDIVFNVPENLLENKIDLKLNYINTFDEEGEVNLNIYHTIINKKNLNLFINNRDFIFKDTTPLNISQYIDLNDLDQIDPIKLIFLDGQMYTKNNLIFMRIERKSNEHGMYLNNFGAGGCIPFQINNIVLEYKIKI